LNRFFCVELGREDWTGVNAEAREKPNMAEFEPVLLRRVGKGRLATGYYYY
jgi:hypothetical protein